MAKIRHIAIRSEDIEKTVQFFQAAFGLEVVQRRGYGAVDLTDGDVNITILPPGLGVCEGELNPGLGHIGFSVEDDEEARQRLLALGAQEMNPVQLGPVHYEAKFRTPEGLIVDIGHWAGTSPIGEGSAPAGAGAGV